MLTSFLITLPLVVCLMMTAELLLSCIRGCPSSQHWLTVWAAVATMLYAGHYVYFHKSMPLLPMADTVYAACNLAVYPLYIIYISEHTDLNPLSSRPLLLTLLLLPAVMALAVVGTLYTMMTPAEQGLFLHGYLYGGSSAGLSGLPLLQARVHTACRALFAAEVAGVLIAGVMKLRRYNRMVDSFCADTDDKHLTHLTATLVGLVLTSVMSIIANYFGRHSFTASAALLAVPSLLFSTLLFFIGWTGRQPHPMLRDMLPSSSTDFCAAVPDVNGATLPPEDESRAAAELSGPGAPTESAAKELPAHTDNSTLGEELERLMHNGQLYLRHDLRLDQVAQLLGTNRTYLLRTLQQVYGMTFKEYVNSLRIAHADRLMEENPTITKNEVVFLSGYNTTSSFYRNYRQYHKPKP